MTRSIRERVQSVAWDRIGESLGNEGFAVLPAFLAQDECTELAAKFGTPEHFRSHVVMARLNFGRGEYKYFKYPLPGVVAELREHLYPRLADIANAWSAHTAGMAFPETHAAYLKRCHAAGQRKPTPLLLKYGPGDFNCLHQDLYGELAFPFQATFFLTPRSDYAGGEFVLVEQRPRMQSRPIVITAEQGQAVIFPTRYRAVKGSRGFYRTNLRHGVSALRSGQRYTLGIIFHDAK